MSKKNNVKKLEKKLKTTHEKVKDFSVLLDSISSLEDKKKILWKEIYQNALSDRESASTLYTDLFATMQSSTGDHAALGSIMSKYLERMCKSNDQILKLAELIAKEETESSRIDPDDIFSKISN